MPTPVPPADILRLPEETIDDLRRPPAPINRTEVRAGTIAAEDVVMYAFIAALLLLIAAFFTYVTVEQRAILERVNPSDLGASGADAGITGALLDAQHNIIAMRYQFASAAVFSNAARANIAFLVGTVLALSGCLVLIRRIQAAPFDASWDFATTMKVKLATSSPGIVLAVLGSIIVVSAIFVDVSVSVQDGGLGLPGMAPPTSAASDAAAAQSRLDSLLNRL